jgi:hypothetical protein
MFCFHICQQHVAGNVSDKLCCILLCHILRCMLLCIICSQLAQGCGFISHYCLPCFQARCFVACKRSMCYLLRLPLRIPRFVRTRPLALSVVRCTESLCSEFIAPLLQPVIFLVFSKRHTRLYYVISLQSFIASGCLARADFIPFAWASARGSAASQ